MTIAQRYLSGLIVGLAMTITATAGPPTGSWNVHANGFIGTMVLNVDNVGVVTGTLFGNPVKGLWTESSRRLVIYRAIGGNTTATPPDNIQIYTGYMFPSSESNPSGPQRLAGDFQVLAGTGAPVRNVFGWYATK
jgi:hypothetical protein